MTPHVQSIITCDAVSATNDGKLNFYGVFNKLRSSSFPLEVPQFTLSVAWSGGKGFHVQVVKMLDQSKSAVLFQSPEMYMSLTDEMETAYVQTHFNQMVFHSPGSYPIQILIDGQVSKELTIECERLE